MANAREYLSLPSRNVSPFQIRSWKGRIIVMASILLAGLVMGVSSSNPTTGQRHLSHILAMPWLDKHPTDSHRLSHFQQATMCSLSVSPVTTDEELSKGIFVHFDIAGITHVVRIAFYNGRFCAIQVLRMDFDQDKIRFQVVAVTKLPHQVLDVKVAVCGGTEAYIVAIVTKDGKESEPQLLVFKPDDKDRSGQTYLIAHNGQLSSMKGVSDVSISCFQDQVVFGLSASTSLTLTGSQKLFSSVRIWSPKTRAVIKLLTAETANAVSVVAFQSDHCLMLVFAQRSNTFAEGPLDSLVYCLLVDDRNIWRLTLIQRLNFCEVSGIELYRNARQELGLFVAISEKAEAHRGCPSSPLSVKWTGRQFVPYGNISTKAVSDFYYFSTPCCNLLAARSVGGERTLSFVGSTEPLFEGVHKMELMSVANRNYLLVSFASDIHHGALHEILCNQRAFTVLPASIRGHGGAVPARYLVPRPSASHMQIAPPQIGMIGGPIPPPLLLPPVNYAPATVYYPPPPQPPPQQQYIPPPPQPQYIPPPPQQQYILPPPIPAPTFNPGPPFIQMGLREARGPNPLASNQPWRPMLVFRPPPAPSPAIFSAHPAVWPAPTGHLQPTTRVLLQDPNPKSIRRRVHAFDELL